MTEFSFKKLNLHQCLVCCIVSNGKGTLFCKIQVGKDQLKGCQSNFGISFS